jgi:hypothetical protein
MNRKLASMIVVPMAVALAIPLASATRNRLLPYQGVISRVAAMVHNSEAQALASRHGLQILNVLWEDTGRWQGSALGPNISDVTIEVADGQGRGQRRALMPVIRFPNFRDKTADVRLDKFFLRVGNQREGGRLEVISLRQFLKSPLEYLSLPEKGTIKGGTLLAARDTHALVSAQAAFLPVPKAGKATFYPVIFNYQSTARNPAVLAILVTRQGTSLTVVDNARDTVTGGRSWGQRLFHNAGGRRAPLTAERLSDVQERGTTSNGESSSSLGEDANLLMLIQVPLKHRAPWRTLAASTASPPGFGGVYKSAEPKREGSRDPDMEVAVLGHGEEEGPYTELDGLTIERDPRFPIRVTVQFYQATSHGQIDDANMTRLARQITTVYEKGDYVGSLVVPAPSDLRRPTNWDGIGPAPKEVSWSNFPGLLERFKKYGLLFPFFIGLW